MIASTATAAGVAAAVLGSALIVASVKPVPDRMTHDVRIHVTGTVQVNAPDLAKLKPGQILPTSITIRGIPHQVTVAVPVTVNGTPQVVVPTEYTVREGR